MKLIEVMDKMTEIKNQVVDLHDEDVLEWEEAFRFETFLDAAFEVIRKAAVRAAGPKVVRVVSLPVPVANTETTVTEVPDDNT